MRNLKFFTVLISLALLVGCASNKPIEYQLDDKFKNRPDNVEIIAAQYLAQNMKTDLGRDNQGAFVAELNESGVLDKLMKEFVVRHGGTVTQGAQSLAESEEVFMEIGDPPVEEITLPAGVLKDALEGIIDFAYDYFMLPRIPQPLNIFRQAKFGRQTYRTREDLRDRY